MSLRIASTRVQRSTVLSEPKPWNNTAPVCLQRVHAEVSRRDISQVALYGCLLTASPAVAIETAPDGYYLHRDRLDGYTFAYPDSWNVVTTSGNDVCYSNPRVADENLFVDISSPSSSKYQSVEDLGTPYEAGLRLKEQFLVEFMSTRLGVRREVELLSYSARMGKNGRLYYDIGVRIQSYASRQQLAVTSAERQEAIIQEFDRVLYTTLGVANMRLYEFRIQTPYKKFEKSLGVYQVMAQSFQCKEV